MPLRRLDSDARAVVDLSNSIAQEFGLEYVGTEHILLALVRHNGGVAANVLQSLGIDEFKVRHAVEEVVRRSKEDTWVFGRLPGTPHYRDVIERAMEIAEQLESSQIRPEHLLLALFRHPDSSAAQALAILGLGRKRCQEEVLKHLSAT